MGYDDLAAFDAELPAAGKPVKRQIEIEARYEEYIRRQNEAVGKFREMERKKIPDDIDYFAIPSLSNELKCKLDAIHPSSFGQAQRIPGMTQAALAAILVQLKKMELEARASAQASSSSKR
jgi:tRNA uridine 5-carboxymethylaminomethyl modification enzyme